MPVSLTRPVIFTWYGAPLSITGNCGDHLPRSSRTPSATDTLLRVRYFSDGPNEGYQWFGRLRCSDTAALVNAALAAPVIELSAGDLIRAIREAN